MKDMLVCVSKNSIRLVLDHPAKELPLTARFIFEAGIFSSSAGEGAVGARPTCPSLTIRSEARSASAYTVLWGEESEGICEHDERPPYAPVCEMKREVERRRHLRPLRFSYRRPSKLSRRHRLCFGEAWHTSRLGGTRFLRSSTPSL